MAAPRKTLAHPSHPPSSRPAPSAPTAPRSRTNRSPPPTPAPACCPPPTRAPTQTGANSSSPPPRPTGWTASTSCLGGCWATGCWWCGGSRRSPWARGTRQRCPSAWSSAARCDENDARWRAVMVGGRLSVGGRRGGFAECGSARPARRALPHIPAAPAPDPPPPRLHRSGNRPGRSSPSVQPRSAAPPASSVRTNSAPWPPSCPN